MQRHHHVHLVVQVLIHKPLAHLHESRVGNHLFGQVREILDGLGIVVAELFRILQIPHTVLRIVRSRYKERARQEFLQSFERNQGSQMAAGHPDAAVRPIVELVGQRMAGIVELQGGIPEELYIVVARTKHQHESR